MDRPIPLLVNAHAGAWQTTAGADQLRRMADDAGARIEVVRSESPDHLREIVRGYVSEGRERIAVAGGDGTVHLVVQELAHSETALGIVQQGTFNNFATALRLPQDISSALRILHDGVPVRVSLGRVQDHYFTEAAGVGLFADGLALYGNESNKNIWRGLGAFLRVFTGFRPHRIRLTLDGQTMEQRAVMVTIANTFRMAQAVPIAPDAKLTDDHLDVVIIGDLTRKELLPYYRAVRAQSHLGLAKVSVLKAATIRVETRRPMHVHVDDQDIGVTPVDIALHPRALSVLVDRL